MTLKMNLILFLSFPLVASAQGIKTIANNNLSGVYGTIANPANAAGGIDRFSFNLMGVGVAVNNNALRSDLDYTVLKIVGRRPLRLEPGNLEKATVTTPRKLVYKPVIYSEIDALQFAAQLALTKKISVYSFARERALANFDKGDYRSLKFLVDEEYNHKEPLVELGFDIRSLAYQELGLGGAFQIYQKKYHYLKLGVTYKRINARGVYAVNVPQFESRLEDSTIKVNAELNVLETALDAATQNPLDFILNPALGTGNALDIGFVYEHRPRSLKSTYRKNNLKKRNKVFNGRNLTKYDYRIGMSLNDLGRVNFNRDAVITTRNSVNATFKPQDLALLTANEYAQQILDSSISQVSSDEVNFGLPTTLTLSYDQRLLNNWFVSATYRQNMVKKSIGAFYTPTNMQVQLRKETKHCVFGFPVQVASATRTFTVGAFAQTGPFFIGTDNLGTLILTHTYNPSFYTGLFYNIRYKADKTIENHRSFKTKRRKVLQWSGM